MTEYRWSTTLERGIDLFGETPSPATENELRASFAKQPARLHGTIESIGAQILAGANIRSGWAIVKKRVDDQQDDIVVTDSGQLEKKIINARRWIHNAGLYFDQEHAVLDELFGQQGILSAFDTPSLRAEMIEAWKQERPRGQRAEQASADYMAKLRADTRRVEAKRREAREAAMEGQEA